LTTLDNNQRQTRTKGFLAPRTIGKRCKDLTFREKIDKVSREKDSRIILALDFPFEEPANKQALFKKAMRLLEEVNPYVCAVKFNHHLILPLGIFDSVQKLITSASDDGVMTIMDCKANDIGSTNQVIAEYYYTAGFNAIIANPFVGWDEGMKPIFEVAKRLDRGVILLVYMSHKAAFEGYGQTILESGTGKRMPQYVSFAKKALEYDADGVVVGATYPEKIKEVYEILGERIPIYSPGIGAQGATLEPAVKSGSRYLIVGREITLSSNPSDVAKRIRNATRSLE
jgi:orotidine-5'-phosphate decarboxylase